ncbi:hypothetical protein Tco_0122828 [Tanacetum coccineum]
MSNNNLQTNTSSALHNAVMEAGGNDRALMLAPAIYGAPPTRPSRVMETYATISEENRKKIDAEDGDIQIFLTGIDNDIYSTVDVSPNAMEICCHSTTSLSSSVIIVSTTLHPLQSKLHFTPRAKRKPLLSDQKLRKKTLPILHSPKNTPSPVYDSELEVVSDEEATPRDKEIEKLMALILMSYKIIYKPTNNKLRTLSNTRNKNVDNTLRSDKRIGYDRQTRQYENQRTTNVARARDNVGTQEAVIQLSVEQVDWRDDTNDELDDQESEAH